MSGQRCLLLALALNSAPASTGHLRGVFDADETLPHFLPETDGPYSEVPSDADAESPRPALKDWRSEVPSWIRDRTDEEGNVDSMKPNVGPFVVDIEERFFFLFCNFHKTGFFCAGLKRIRCCKRDDGYWAKCGSTANSTFCAAHTSKEDVGAGPPEMPDGGAGHIEVPDEAPEDPRPEDWMSEVPNLPPDDSAAEGSDDGEP